MCVCRYVCVKSVCIFLLGGIGELDIKKRPNFMIVEKGICVYACDVFVVTCADHRYSVY